MLLRRLCLPFVEEFPSETMGERGTVTGGTGNSEYRMRLPSVSDVHPLAALSVLSAMPDAFVFRDPTRKWEGFLVRHCPACFGSSGWDMGCWTY